jgi:glycerophosphoryl diester phosphodiesterase
MTQAPPAATRKRALWKRLLIGLTMLVVFYLAVFLLEAPARPGHAFFQADAPMVIAHRGGAALAPENTLAAFEKARSLGVDVIEFDVRMTRDGHLVVVHDLSINRTTNGEGGVHEFSLEEIGKFDAAYRFSTDGKEFPYRGRGLRIPTVEDVFRQFGDLRMSIEIKTPPTVMGYPDIELKLWNLIEQYGMHDKVLISSFSHEIMTRFARHSGDRVALSASGREARTFILLHRIFLTPLYRPESDAFQIPVAYGALRLDDERLILNARNLNMAVIYWTVNEEEAMRRLLARGASGIITDRPDLLMKVRDGTPRPALPLQSRR